jgi:hypothetical protein
VHRRNRHTTVRLAASALCVAFIVIVLIKGVWILAVFGAAVLALQVINLLLGPRQRRRPRPPAPPRASVAEPPPASRASVAEAPPRRSGPRGREAARRRARRGRGR